MGGMAVGPMLLLHRGSRPSSEWAGFQDPVFDRLSLNDVLVKDAVNAFWGDTAIPSAIRPDQQDRALLTDA